MRHTCAVMIAWLTVVSRVPTCANPDEGNDERVAALVTELESTDDERRLAATTELLARVPVDAKVIRAIVRSTQEDYGYFYTTCNLLNRCGVGVIDVLVKELRASEGTDPQKNGQRCASYTLALFGKEPRIDESLVIAALPDACQRSQHELLWILGHNGTSQCLDAVLACAKSDLDPNLQLSALLSLAMLGATAKGTDNELAVIVKTSENRHGRNFKRFALDAQCAISDDATLKLDVAALNAEDEDPMVRAHVARTLHHFSAELSGNSLDRQDREKAEGVVRRLLSDPELAVVRDTLVSVRKSGFQSVAVALELIRLAGRQQLAGDRLYVLQILSEKCDLTYGLAVPLVAKELDSGDDPVRLAALVCLANYGVRAAGALPSIVSAIAFGSRPVSQSARDVLGRLIPRD